jgi:hypothetical protein
VERLEEQMRLLFIPFAAKFGATGNYNAHHVAYPQIDWRKFEEPLLKKGYTTFPDHTNRTLRSLCSIF